MVDTPDASGERKKGGLIQVSPLYPSDDILQVFGEITFLAYYTKMYQDWPIRLMARAFEPPVYLKQFTVYRARNIPRGVVTWAKLSPEAEKKHLSGNGLDDFDEWNSGEQFWVMDIMAPWGHGGEIIRNIVDTIQEDSVKTVRIHKGRKKIVEWFREPGTKKFRLRSFPLSEDKSR